MGSGKTSAAINYINDHRDDNKFIYITPYLEEVERIKTLCHFVEPINYTQNTPKRVSLIDSLNRGLNIVTTHSMFHLFDDEIIDLCKAQGYILIMDEVTDVVEPYQMQRKDLHILLDNFVEADENGILHWTGTEVTEKFADEKRLCDLGCLAVYADTAVVWLFPVKIFEAFEESFILTYMFSAQTQRYYYDYYGLEYEYIYVKGDSLDSYQFSGEPVSYVGKYDYKKLINIIEDEKMNMIGEGEGALSKTWYIRNQDNVLMKKVKNNLYNFFNNKPVLLQDGEYVTSNSGANLWTTFSDYQDKLSGKGYAKGFIALNLRATNQYRDRSVVAYTVNRYFNPVVKHFFTTKNIDVDEEGYAVSEMVQFIWRSAIRDGKPISLYIPSRRMRKLLEKWIEQN